MQGKRFGGGGSGFSQPRARERLPQPKVFRPLPSSRRLKPVAHRRMPRPVDLVDTENLADDAGQELPPGYSDRPDAMKFDEVAPGLEDRPGPISGFLRKFGL